MTDQYPPPAHAAMIWTNGTTLFIRTADERGAHTVALPHSTGGLAVLSRALRDRHVAYAAGKPPTLGLAGALSQAQMAKLCAALEPTKVAMGVSGLPAAETGKGGARRAPAEPLRPLSASALDDLFGEAP
jgi:hypothetical protein